MSHRRFGAIDIGSNSIRLLVVEATGEWRNNGRLRAVARAGEPCRLGQGLGRTGRIEAEMAERAAALAADFMQRARALGALHVVVGATAALRRAENREEVAGVVGQRLGLPVRILSGEEEARLVYESVVSGLGPAALRSSCVVFDIGGGSTEVVSGFGIEAGRWVSLPFGAVNLTERFVRSNPPAREEVAAVRESVRDKLMHECASMPAETPVLAGVGGTVTILALLDRDLASYDPAMIQGWIIRTERLRALVSRISSLTHDQRRKLPAMGDGRADIVVAGCIAVEALANRFPSAGLVCSTQGLRYGLARLAADEWSARRRPEGEPRPSS